jgi:hypothetical protein
MRTDIAIFPVQNAFLSEKYAVPDGGRGFHVWNPTVEMLYYINDHKTINIGIIPEKERIKSDERTH